MRLIDADTLITHIRSDCAIVEDKSGLLPGDLLYEKAVYMAIQHEPTVDTPPIVRCEECKHYSYFGEGRYFCKLHSNYEHFVRMNKNAFCSYGEREDK